MKILIILATILMVPIMMKFQHKTIVDKGGPVLQARALTILKEAGVANGTVEINFLEATLGGRVDSLKLAEELASKIKNLRGISSVVNQLSVGGRLKISRGSDGLIFSGMVPPGWREELLRQQKGADAKELDERAGTLLDEGVSPLEFALFVDGFFSSEGKRMLDFQNGSILLSGEVIPSSTADLLADAKSLSPSLEVEEEFARYPSVFHFPSRELESPINGEALRQLQRDLLELTISFKDGKALPDAEGQKRLTVLKETLLGGDSGLRFVLGCHLDDGGDELAIRRATFVARELLAAGLPAEALEMHAFETTEETAGLRGQVELLIR